MTTEIYIGQWQKFLGRLLVDCDVVVDARNNFFGIDERAFRVQT